MSRAGALLTLLGLVWVTAEAQTVSIGGQGVLAEYREVSSDLSYRGAGGGMSVWLRHGALRVEGSLHQTSYHPQDENSGLIDFKATQLDVLLGYEFRSGLTAEVGVLRRDVNPRFSAQEMRAGRIGLTYSRPIGPGVTVGLRGGYFVGAKFSGGGSAPLAFELGLLLSVGPTTARYRLTAAYGFHRVDRKVDGTPVPIELSLLRLGAAVGF